MENTAQNADTARLVAETRIHLDTALRALRDADDRGLFWVHGAVYSKQTPEAYMATALVDIAGAYITALKQHLDGILDSKGAENPLAETRTWLDKSRKVSFHVIPTMESLKEALKKVEDLEARELVLNALATAYAFYRIAEGEINAVYALFDEAQQN
jgi:hypothetical protein